MDSSNSLNGAQGTDGDQNLTSHDDSQTHDDFIDAAEQADVVGPVVGTQETAGDHDNDSHFNLTFRNNSHLDLANPALTTPALANPAHGLGIFLPRNVGTTNLPPALAAPTNVANQAPVGNNWLEQTWTFAGVPLPGAASGRASPDSQHFESAPGTPEGQEEAAGEGEEEDDEDDDDNDDDDDDDLLLAMEMQAEDDEDDNDDEDDDEEEDFGEDFDIDEIAEGDPGAARDLRAAFDDLREVRLEVDDLDNQLPLPPGQFVRGNRAAIRARGALLSAEEHILVAVGQLWGRVGAEREATAAAGAALRQYQDEAGNLADLLVEAQRRADVATGRAFANAASLEEARLELVLLQRRLRDAGL